MGGQAVLRPWRWLCRRGTTGRNRDIARRLACSPTFGGLRAVVRSNGPKRGEPQSIRTGRLEPFTRPSRVYTFPVLGKGLRWNWLWARVVSAVNNRRSFRHRRVFHCASDLGATLLARHHLRYLLYLTSTGGGAGIASVAGSICFIGPAAPSDCGPRPLATISLLPRSGLRR